MLQLSFVNFRRGSYLVVEGKADYNRFYIIQNGRVGIKKEVEVPTEDQKILGPGDFVGVVSCMANKSQIESAIALTDVVAISVLHEQYPELIQNNTPVAMKIIRTFANKMRTLNENLTKITLNNTVVSSNEQLFSVASYYDNAGKPDLAVFSYYQYLKACPTGEHVEQAKKRFVALKPKSKAVYFEPTTETVRNYPINTMIFSECQNGQEMFIIQEGQVKITKIVEGNEVILAVIKKGEFFGEMALLENKPRSACAIAHEDCKLMTINRQNFNQMVATQPQLIARLTTTLADRLWAMSRQMINTQIREPLHRLIDMLSLQIEKARIPVAKGTSYTLDISIYELANMCGIPQEQQATCLSQLMNDSRVKVNRNKITIPDCKELLDSAAFYRKQAR